MAGAHASEKANETEQKGAEAGLCRAQLQQTASGQSGRVADTLRGSLEHKQQQGNRGSTGCRNSINLYTRNSGLRRAGAAPALVMQAASGSSRGDLQLEALHRLLYFCKQLLVGC